MVYLDHCAWRKLSDDSDLRTRLTAAIRNKSGTLALSWVNIAEFSRVLDAGQIQRAERLLDDVLPNVFFIEINPFTVSKREAEGHPMPHDDRVFLENFVKTPRPGMRLISAEGYFSILQDTDVPNSLLDLASSTARSVQVLADSYATDPNFKNQVNRKYRKKPGVKLVLQELIRTYLIDGKSRFDSHDAIDLMHASVPIAYCDFVVLDGAWKHRANQIRSRFEQGTGSLPSAEVFSANDAGLNQFLAALSTAKPPAE